MPSTSPRLPRRCIALLCILRDPGKYVSQQAANLLLVCCALAFAATPSAPAVPVSQEPKPAATSATKPEAQALIYVYRQRHTLGAAGHPVVFVNHEYLGELHNSDYAQYKVPSGTVLVGATHAIMGSQVPGEEAVRVRVEIDAEAGKTYYVKWSVSSSGGKMQLVEAAKGAREIKGLHSVKR